MDRSLHSTFYQEHLDIEFVGALGECNWKRVIGFENEKKKEITSGDKDNKVNKLTGGLSQITLTRKGQACPIS